VHDVVVLPAFELRDADVPGGLGRVLQVGDATFVAARLAQQTRDGGAFVVLA
jgi:hypothetical protein